MIVSIMSLYNLVLSSTTILWPILLWQGLQKSTAMRIFSALQVGKDNSKTVKAAYHTETVQS